MTDWLVSAPVWGPRCTDIFLKYSFPAIEKALTQIDPTDKVRFIIHTDNVDQMRESLPVDRWQFDILPVPETTPNPEHNNHISLGDVHRDVLTKARDGEAVAFINADMVCSIEVFAAAGKRIMDGKRLIMCMGTRTNGDAGYVPPIGAKSSDLLAWAWEHRHLWITNCIWGSGRSKSPTVLYFPVSDGVVLHAFHLHPFVVVKHEGLTFNQVTIDADLVERFPLERIHVVTDANELSFAEISPQDLPVGGQGLLPGPITKVFVAGFARNVANHVHRWFFGHRIIIIGPATELSEISTCAEILAAIDLFIPAPPPVDENAHWLSAERREVLQKQREQRTKPFAYVAEFHIVLPAWGERHVAFACDYVIPSLRAALLSGQYKARFVAYTDQPERIKEALGGFSSDIRQVPVLGKEVKLVDQLSTEPHRTLTLIHKQALIETPAGSVTVLLCGDIVMSKEFFAYASGAFLNGRRVIASMAPRVLMKDTDPPPVGVDGRELLSWAWRNRHEITESCVWGRTRTSFPNTLFFEEGENVVMCSYHLHPFLVMKDRNCTFAGTVDDDLLANFEDHEIQYVENAEIGFAEISPPEFNRGQYCIDAPPVTIESAAYFARNTMPAHLRSFQHKLRVKGFGDVPGATSVIKEIVIKIRPSRHHPLPGPITNPTNPSVESSSILPSGAGASP